MAAPTVTIHVKPYTSEWLQRNFGNPVQLPAKSTIKQVVMSCLEKKFYPSRESGLKALPARVDFRVPHSAHTIHGNCVQLQLQHHINDIFEEQIKNELFLYIYAHNIKGVTINKAVLLYQTQFGFRESSFSLEAIRTAYFRKKREIERVFCGTDTKTLRHA